MLNQFRNRSVDDAVDEAIAYRRRMDSLSEKRTEELDYWIKRKNEEGTLHAEWYEYFYTEHFGLGVEDYAGLHVLDIGCGPRGSLDWAENAAERIGLDPLADDYRKLRPEGYQMEMIASGSESIPFADGNYDIVASFHSRDLGDDLDETTPEIKRVVRPG
ncbi:MAG: methyltransferase domain-containing protein, partial [Gemmatimonadetes bacterium]|nr:methyltransferase domain-containing protein [Gemmatimonadota bacterium]